VPPTTEQQGRLTIIIQLMVQGQPIGALITAVPTMPTIAVATVTPMTALEQLMVLAVDPPPGAMDPAVLLAGVVALPRGVMAAVAPQDSVAAQLPGAVDKRTP
jgi:hypothetical protein